MAEPMEESVADGKPSSLLRPYSMVMMTITVEDYETQYWPKLEAAINQLLTMSPGQYIPISYEQMYSCVYKCVCKQFSERLYHDLLSQISDHLERLSLQLQCAESKQYVEGFHYALNQYLQALSGIVPIFNYMNRFYVESKLKTDLNKELRLLFVKHVADKHVPNLIPVLMEAVTRPFWVQPAVLATLMRNLYELNPDFAKLRPHLFARFLPNILPPTSEAELDQYIAEARQMQQDLLTHPEFISGDQSRKRRTDDEMQKTTPLSFLPKNHNT